MNRTISKLSPTDTKKLVRDFLLSIGERLRDKRVYKSLSQSELADCLDIDQSTLSKYENGDRDMNISLLPLFSTYCNFPLYELFPKDESQMILDTFASAVKIVVERKKRKQRLQKNRTIRELKMRGESEKILKGQVYDINGQEVFEPVKEKASTQSMKTRLRDADIQTQVEPYTAEEFCGYIMEQPTDISDSIASAGQFLMQIRDMKQKDTIRNVLADYIIDELIINHVIKKPSVYAMRAYAYYCRLYMEEMYRDSDTED